MWRESALLHLLVICFTSDKGTRFVSIMKYISTMVCGALDGLWTTEVVMISYTNNNW